MKKKRLGGEEWFIVGESDAELGDKRRIMTRRR